MAGICLLPAIPRFLRPFFGPRRNGEALAPAMDANLLVRDLPAASLAARFLNHRSSNGTIPSLICNWRRSPGRRIRRIGPSRTAPTICVHYDTADFSVVDDPSDEEKKHLYREVRYFYPDDPPDSRKPVKTCLYYPDGSCFADLDQAGDTVFNPLFFFPEEYCRNTRRPMAKMGGRTGSRSGNGNAQLLFRRLRFPDGP